MKCKQHGIMKKEVVNGITYNWCVKCGDVKIEDGNIRLTTYRKAWKILREIQPQSKPKFFTKTGLADEMAKRGMKDFDTSTKYINIFASEPGSRAPLIEHKLNVGKDKTDILYEFRHDNPLSTTFINKELFKLIQE